MSLYVIGDLHLSIGADKPMDVFGGVWEGYIEKIKTGFSMLKDDDETVLCGDLSWALSLDDALEDFRFIDRMPGRKHIIKGNHDYFWTTVSKMRRFFTENGLNSINIIHNSFVMYGKTALCGTRGWFFEDDFAQSHDEKIFRRELSRLEASLLAASREEPDEIISFLHYPPVSEGFSHTEMTELLRKYGVSRCFYGHLHGGARRAAVEGIVGDIDYRLISADNLNFIPLKII